MPGEEDTYHSLFFHLLSQANKNTVYRYAEAKELGIFREIGEHEFAGVNAGEIMGRILKQRALYEERQRRKGAKAKDEDNMSN